LYSCALRGEKSLSGRRDSDPRISAWKADALPLGHARELRTVFYLNSGRLGRGSIQSRLLSQWIASDYPYVKITEDIDWFACSACGNEHIVNRNGGIIALKPVIDGIKSIQLGVDKTASELAIVRLKDEIQILENDLSQVSNKKGCLKDTFVRIMLITLCLAGIAMLTTPNNKILGGILSSGGIGMFLLGRVLDQAASDMYKKQADRINRKLQSKKKEMAVHQKNVSNI
jgi:hypothetical protein